jgi:uncharacterized Zn finger protein
VHPSDFHDQHGGDRFPPPSAPRKVTGGIRLQARGAQPVGKNWWARRWMAALESLGMGERLERGRAYARGGQVLTLEVELGAIAATVQGTRLEPYATRIDVTPFTQLEWVGLAESFAARAGFRAQLLAGQLPDDAEVIVARAGQRLFPSEEDDLRFTCSCADWASPCRHAAAVCYLVGEAFDRDPFLLFRLRGIERELLLGLLDARDATDIDSDAPAPALDATDIEPAADGDVATSAGHATDTLDPWLGVQLETTPRLDLTPPPTDAPLVRLLGAPPYWRGTDDFEPTMRRMYERVANDGRTLDLALGVAPPEPEPAEPADPSTAAT